MGETISIREGGVDICICVCVHFMHALRFGASKSFLDASYSKDGLQFIHEHSIRSNFVRKGLLMPKIVKLVTLCNVSVGLPLSSSFYRTIAGVEKRTVMELAVLLIIPRGTFSSENYRIKRNGSLRETSSKSDQIMFSPNSSPRPIEAKVSHAHALQTPQAKPQRQRTTCLAVAVAEANAMPQLKNHGAPFSNGTNGIQSRNVHRRPKCLPTVDAHANDWLSRY